MLIVDDSAVMRNLIGKIVAGSEDLVVAGKALNGAFALQKIATLKPDVVVLDLEMPDMNGIDFLKERKRRGIDVPIVILSSRAERGAQITMEAISLGAADFIMKPIGAGSEEIFGIAENLAHLLRGYGRIYQETKADEARTDESRGQEGASLAPLKGSDAGPSGATKAGPPSVGQATDVSITAPDSPAVDVFESTLRRLQPEAEWSRRRRAPASVADWGSGFPYPRQAGRFGEGAIEIVAIGVSTGGPNALREVLSRIDARIGVPIVVVQHMPPGFTAEFARSLAKICPLEVKEAEEGDLLLPGRVLIAPGANHLRVDRRPLAAVASLGEDAPVNGHRPSVGVLFESVARGFRAGSLAVIMTGMGRDGAREIGEIHRGGGLTIAQDEASCVVFGMPKVAIESGAIQYVVPLTDMAPAINWLVENTR